MCAAKSRLIVSNHFWHLFDSPIFCVSIEHDMATLDLQGRLHFLLSLIKPKLFYGQIVLDTKLLLPFSCCFVAEREREQIDSFDLRL
jgi:hypothetical protein